MYVVVEWNRLQAKQSREEIPESMYVGSLVISVATSHSSLVSAALSPICDKFRNGRHVRLCNGKGRKAQPYLYVDRSFVTAYSPLLETRTCEAESSCLKLKEIFLQ